MIKIDTTTLMSDAKNDILKANLINERFTRTNIQIYSSRKTSLKLNTKYPTFITDIVVLGLRIYNNLPDQQLPIQLWMKLIRQTNEPANMSK